MPVNWVTSQAGRPDILAATWAFTKGTLMHGQLPPTVKQMIAMVIAMQNDCRYCEVSFFYEVLDGDPPDLLCLKRETLAEFEQGIVLYHDILYILECRFCFF